MSDVVIRKQLLALLQGGNAHLRFDEAVAEFPMDRINEPFPNGDYSAWGLLEHMRITQADILDFMRNPEYQERDWPRESWPAPGRQATEADWQRTLAGFDSDAKELERIVQDPSTDLYSDLPWGNGQNILREILLIADHNSHHLGELSIMRQVMATWRTDRKQFDLEYARRRSQ